MGSRGWQPPQRPLPGSLSLPGRYGEKEGGVWLWWGVVGHEGGLDGWAGGRTVRQCLLGWGLSTICNGSHAHMNMRYTKPGCFLSWVGLGVACLEIRAWWVACLEMGCDGGVPGWKGVANSTARGKMSLPSTGRKGERSGFDMFPAQAEGRVAMGDGWWAAFVVARHRCASSHKPRRSRSRYLDHRIVCPSFLKMEGSSSSFGADLDNGPGQACPGLKMMLHPLTTFQTGQCR